MTQGVANAIYLAGTISKPGETEVEYSRRYVANILLAAGKGSADTLFCLGRFYDVGDEGFAQDKDKASLLFKQAADLGHARSQWIHACELLWGRGTFAQDVEAGLAHLRKSVGQGFAEALGTKPDLDDTGGFGVPKDHRLAAELRQREAAAIEDSRDLR